MVAGGILPTVTDTQAVLTTAVTKGVRYEKALFAIEKDEKCSIYTKEKANFKTIVQDCLRNGIAIEDFKQELAKSGITLETQKKLRTSIDKKMARYKKKLTFPERKSTTTLVQFTQAAEGLKKSFDAFNNDVSSAQIYREFRIAKKGLKDDSTEYVGFFKYIKRNLKTTYDNAELLKTMCREAGIVHDKVSSKINHACKAYDSKQRQETKKDDSTGYVGFFEYIKRNLKTTYDNAKWLKTMCRKAGIVHDKVSSKIVHACKSLRQQARTGN